MKHEKVIQALKEKGYDVLPGEGGFFLKGGIGGKFISLRQAYKLTGITGERRIMRPRIQAWGDYATIVAMNQCRRTDDNNE